MRHLINKEKKTEVTISDLNGDELIAYKCKSDSGAYAVLSKLTNFQWGFIPLNNSNSNPRYIGKGWFSSIKEASKSRDLKVFDSMKEMLSAMINKEF